MPAACGFLPTTAKPILNMGFILEINLLVCSTWSCFLKYAKEWGIRLNWGLWTVFFRSRILFFLIWAFFIVVVTSHDSMGHKLGGKKTGLGSAVVVKMCVDGRESTYARIRHLGICWCKEWARVAVEAILKNYPPQSHSFHFLLTCVPSGLRKYFVFIFHEAFSPLLSQAELTPESLELMALPKACSSMLARRDE